MTPDLVQKILKSHHVSYLCIGPSAVEGAIQLAQGILSGKRDLDRSPNFIHVVPEKETIKIEQIRRLIDRLSLKPMEGERVVVLLEEADRMTEGAANALLKTLEEPPSFACFLLAAQVPEKLPLTIRSRCQRLTFASESKGEEKSRESTLTLWHEKIMPSLLEGRSFAKATRLAEEFLDETDELLPFLEGLKVWWRDLILLHEKGDKNLVNGKEGLERFAAGRSADRIFREFDLILETERAIQGNVMKQLAMERLFFNLMS